MANFTLSLLILLALAASWYLGYRSRAIKPQGPRRKLERDYFIGLNYLLNEEPDDSVDIFIDALEVNSSTLESYMALGTLLCRRGKVDRSISIYQSLLARPQLSIDEIHQVKLGLVRSYVAAGLLDRAERVIDELKSANAEVRQAALNQGISVYQLEKEWHKAIAVIREIVKVCPAHQRPTYHDLAAHFYCELAQQEISRQHFNQARDYLREAARLNRNNVRVSLMAGALEHQQGNYRKAIRMLQRIRHQDEAFVPESFVLLLDCYKKVGTEKELEKFIQFNTQGKVTPQMLEEILDYLGESMGEEVARNFALDQIRMNPSMEILSKALPVIEGEEGCNELLKQSIKDVAHATLKSRARYQCHNCGFELKQLHWLCPSCNQWSKIKPMATASEP